MIQLLTLSEIQFNFQLIESELQINNRLLFYNLIFVICKLLKVALTVFENKLKLSLK